MESFHDSSTGSGGLLTPASTFGFMNVLDNEEAAM